MSLLQKFFEKRNIKPEEMTLEEKATYDNWKSILSGGEMTVDKIKQFCVSQRSMIESQWRNMENSSQKNDRLIGIYSVYGLLLEVIDAPNKEKERLEKHLTNLLQSP